MRRSLCIRPALCLMLVCLLLLPCAGCGEKTDPFQSYFSEKPFVEFLTEEETAALRAQFPEEFQWLDVMLGPVTLFREDALELVTDQAIEDSGSGFAQIPGAAYALAFERAAQDFNAEQAAKAEQAQGGLLELLRANPDQLEVRNRVVETVVPYGALKGVEGDQVCVGGHLTKEVSVGCATGEELLGHTIGSLVVSKEVSYTIDGPTSSDYIKAGIRASHRWAFGILYGSIQHTEYDLYNVYTGKLDSHYSFNTVTSPDRNVIALLFRAPGSSGPTYLASLDGTRVFEFDTIRDAAKDVCESPGKYLLASDD